MSGNVSVVWLKFLWKYTFFCISTLERLFLLNFCIIVSKGKDWFCDSGQLFTHNVITLNICSALFIWNQISVLYSTFWGEFFLHSPCPHFHCISIFFCWHPIRKTFGQSNQSIILTGIAERKHGKKLKYHYKPNKAQNDFW